MRTSIDIPDALMEEIRTALKARGITFREAAIEGLRRTLLTEEKPVKFQLRDASFRGVPGFMPGFDAEALTESIRADGEVRLIADHDGRHEY